MVKEKVIYHSEEWVKERKHSAQIQILDNKEVVVALYDKPYESLESAAEHLEMLAKELREFKKPKK